MLTMKYILRVARLSDQMDELRPGFLHDAKFNQKGPPDQEEPVAGGVRQTSRCANHKRTAKVGHRLVSQLDAKSGDVRFVQEKTRM